MATVKGFLAVYTFTHVLRDGTVQVLKAKELANGKIRLGIHLFNNFDELYEMLENRKLNKLTLQSTRYE